MPDLSPRRRPRSSGRLARGAAASSLLLAAATLAACGGGSSTPGGGTADGGTAAAVELTATTPAADGAIDQLVWALPYGEPTSLDPVKVGDYSPDTVVGNVCEGLMGVTAEFDFEPRLAERVSRPNPRTLVFDLRDDVSFTDGKPLTAEDVVYSLDRNRDRATASFWAGTYAAVSSIERTGPRQVTVRFSKPDAIFEQMMATVAGYVSEKAYVESRGADYGTPNGGVMCTGPFALERWASGDSITLTRNDNYWNPELKAKAASVSFRFLSDPSTLTSALLSGEVDGSYEVPSTSVTVLSRSPSGTLYTGPSTQISELLPTQAAGPMADPRMRAALDLAIDKDALVRNVWKGAATPLNTMIPPSAWGGGEARAVYQAGYDALPRTGEAQIEQAKALVAEARPESTSFTVGVGAGDQSGLQTLTFMQAAAKEIGLQMTIKQMQPTEFSDAFYNPDARSGLDFLYALGYLEIPNPLLYAPYYTQPRGLFNWTGYDDPKVAGLIDEALTQVDPVRSARLFVEAQARYTPQRLVIPLATPAERLYMNERISGAPASFAYMSMPWAAMIGATK